MIDNTTKEQPPVTLSTMQYHQYENRDATLRATLSNGIDIEVTNGHLSINFKDKFSIRVYEHEKGEGLDRPYDSIVVQPDGWRLNRKEMTVYHYDKEAGTNRYPELTEEELTKRAIPSYEACLIVTEKTKAILDHEKEEQKQRELEHAASVKGKRKK